MHHDISMRAIFTCMFVFIGFYCGFVVEQNSACFSKREKKTVEEAFAEFILKDFGI